MICWRLNGMTPLVLLFVKHRVCHVSFFDVIACTDLRDKLRIERLKTIVLHVSLVFNTFKTQCPKMISWNANTFYCFNIHIQSHIHLKHWMNKTRTCQANYLSFGKEYFIFLKDHLMSVDCSYLKTHVFVFINYFVIYNYRNNPGNDDFRRVK